MERICLQHRGSGGFWKRPLRLLRLIAGDGGSSTSKEDVKGRAKTSINHKDPRSIEGQKFKEQQPE